MRMRVLLATAGLMASLATVGGAVGQAQAAPSDCARKYLCAYPQTNYRGGAGPVQDSNPDLRQYPKFRHVQSIFNNGASCTALIPPPEPLADLQLSPEQQQSLRHAEDVLVRRCMRDRGMDFHVAGTAEAPASLPNPYGLLDSAEVAERGYGLHGAAPVPSDPRLTDRERDALFGTEASQKTIPLAEGGELVVHTDGCFYQAQTELYGEDWKRLLHGEETLAAKIVARVNRDPRVNATQHTWARCMRRAGYSVTTLEDVRPDAMRRMEREASDRADGEAEFNALLDQAARDVACQKRARVEPAIRAAQKAVERSVVRGHQHDLGELKTLRAEALATARRLGGATE